MNPDPNAKGDRPSPFKGGLFRIAIKLPDSYPAEPPEVRGSLSVVRGLFNCVDERSPCVPPTRIYPGPHPCISTHSFHHLRTHALQVAFQTRVWHPQIAPESGKPCVDFLKEQWKPTHGLRDVLVMLRQLLGSPSQSECSHEASAAMLHMNRATCTPGSSSVVYAPCPRPSLLISLVCR